MMEGISSILVFFFGFLFVSIIMRPGGMRHEQIKTKRIRNVLV